MSRCHWLVAILTLLLHASIQAQNAGPIPQGTLRLTLRSRSVAPADLENPFRYQTVQWDAKRTAVVVCDMWARHWCESACQRGAEIAPRINQYVEAARQRGALIVHAPSGGMQHYAEHPARKRAVTAPQAVNLPEGIDRWCRQIPAEQDATWPIDQADGGCDDQPKCPQRPLDTRQTPVIKIHNEDAISDSGSECWNLFEQRGIENVLVLGVHTNMCVLGRPFGLRNMVRFGKRVALVRDLTDSMYNPRCEPQVSHVRGTELVIEHIEKYVCPTVTSTDLLDLPAMRFAEDNRPHIAFLVSDDHYDAEKTLPVFAQELRERYGCYCTILHGQGTSDIPSTAELEEADCLVVFIRRLALPKFQLDRVRRYVASGKAVIGLRTASHAFDVRGKSLPGQAEWPEFDAVVLGGNYHNHGANDLGTDVQNVAERVDHAILKGVEPDSWHSVGSLYFTKPVAENATVLMTGSSSESTEPLTWVRMHGDSRVFYSGLGHPEDFQQPAFRRLLINAIFWAIDKPVPQASSTVSP